MAQTLQDFKNYLTTNKSSIDSSKMKWLTKEQQNAMYNEWKQTWSISNSYMKPVTSNVKTQVVNKDNKATTPPVNTKVTWSSVTDAYKNKFSIWNVSEWNIMSDKLTWTLTAMKEQNKWFAKEQEDILKAWAKEESWLIAEKNKWAIDRANTNQATIDANKQRDYESNEDRRKEADDLLRRQEWIAARQANIAAAQAGSSWLQLSDAAISDIKADTIAKYGQNLANAEQFRNQTNMTLDTALQNIDQNYFKNKSEIDDLLNKLDDEESRPLINAVQAATKWNTQAIEDVKTYYNSLVQKKWEEEYGRMAKEERIADNENIWKNASKDKRLALLQDEFKEAWVMDAYIGNPEKFANMTYADAYNTIMKDIQKLADKTNLVNLYDSYSRTWQKVPDWLEETIKWMWTDYEEAKARTDKTFEDKTWNVTYSNQMTNTKSTWMQTTEVKPLPAKAMWQLDTAFNKLWKDKTIQKLKDGLAKWSITQDVYDRSINYINNK